MFNVEQQTICTIYTSCPRQVAEPHVAKDSWSPRALSEKICRSALSTWAVATSGGSDDITCLVIKTSGNIPFATTHGMGGAIQEEGATSLRAATETEQEHAPVLEGAKNDIIVRESPRPRGNSAAVAVKPGVLQTESIRPKG